MPACFVKVDYSLEYSFLLPLTRWEIDYVSFLPSLHRSQAMSSGLLRWYILSFGCSLDLSVCLLFSSLTPFRNLIKPSSFRGMMANKAKVWGPNQMDNMTTGKDNWTKIHWIGGSFSIRSIWLKICAGLHLCPISTARPTVHVSEKLLR